MKLKVKMSIEDFSGNKEMLDFSNCSNKSKYYDDSNKLVIGKMKDETGGVAIEEIFGLKPRMYSFLVKENSAHRKAKGVNRNDVAATNYNEYKNKWVINKCLRHSMNRNESKTDKISLACFDDKICIQNSGYDGLPLGYQSYPKNSYPNDYF